jgi:hypothetical protein
MVRSNDVTRTAPQASGILQIRTPPPPDSQARLLDSLGDEEGDISTREGREAFWQHLLDRFKLLEWEQERQNEAFHLLRARLDVNVHVPPDGADLTAEQAASLAAKIAGYSGDDAPDVSSLVIYLDNVTAAALLTGA